MLQILSIVISGLFGAWITNIFTWKIKNKIESLDALHFMVLNYNQKFLKYARSKITRDEFRDEANIFEQAMLHHCFVVDGKKAGYVHEKIYQWTKLIDDIINGEKKEIFENKLQQFTVDKSLYPTNYPDLVKQYREALNSAELNVLQARKRTMSFCYMLKQLWPI